MDVLDVCTSKQGEDSLDTLLLADYERKAITKNFKAREFILAVEAKMAQMPGTLYGRAAAPLKHTFFDGGYVREIFMQKGMTCTSKIHKYSHPYFILKGDVSILTEQGEIRYKAPFSGITLAGTKRVLYMHEDTTWITVHVTKGRDIQEIEDEIIAENFEAFDRFQIESGLEEVKLIEEET